MEKKKYLSVKEFSERAGKSTQAIYQRLAKDLQSYCKVIDNKKMVDIAALELFENEEDCKQLDNNLTSTLQATLKTLESQLEIKDKQIAAKDQQIKELTSALMNEQQSALQSQALHAGTVKSIETRPGEEPNKEIRKKKWFWRG